MILDALALPASAKKRNLAIGRKALDEFLADPERSKWFDTIASGASPMWVSHTMLGLGIQNTHYKRRLDAQFVSDFVAYMAKEHFIKITDRELAHFERIAQRTG